MHVEQKGFAHHCSLLAVVTGVTTVAAAVDVVVQWEHFPWDYQPLYLMLFLDCSVDSS